MKLSQGAREQEARRKPGDPQKEGETTMSLFDDDFYSTKVRRRDRRQEQTGSGRGFGLGAGSGKGLGTGAGWRGLRDFLSSATLRVAVASSLVSAVAVALLFALFLDGRQPEPEARPALTGGQSLVETSERIISASEKIRPTVVSIINITQQSQNGDNAEDGGESGGFGDGDLFPEEANLGSGVIFEKKKGHAYIVTNAHVVADAAKVQAVLMDGSKKTATIVGQDPISDLAVLSVDADGIDAVAEIGNSGKLRVGEMVIAVGNPLGFGDSVTNGIISFLHRIVPVSLGQDGIYDWEQEVIQTTAPINQGNSGGVLADLNGRVIGINSMKIADTGVEGIGFAIPIDTVMPIVQELIEHGHVLRPYMGVYSMDLAAFLDQPAGEEGSGDEESLEPIIPEGVKNGVLVLEAVGPADKAGLQLNDIITELDGEAIHGTKDLRKYLYNEKKIGDTLTVTYYRDGKKEKLKLVLTEKEAEQ